MLSQPTSKSFWKDINDIPASVKTRAQYKQQKLVTNRAYDKYFRDKKRKDIERWPMADDSEVVILNVFNYATYFFSTRHNLVAFLLNILLNVKNEWLWFCYCRSIRGKCSVCQFRDVYKDDEYEIYQNCFDLHQLLFPLIFFFFFNY